MREIKWIELGKFCLGIVSVLLLVTVPALLLQPFQESRILETQAETVQDLTNMATVDDIVHVGTGNRRSDFYRIGNGDSVVFLTAALDNRSVALAVRLDRAQQLKDCRIMSSLMPPSTELIQHFAGLVHDGRLTTPSMDQSLLHAEGIQLSSNGGRIYRGFIAALNRAVEISRKAGQL